MKQKVIVISAHPDDETLGVGGTLLKHKAQGDEIYWLILTEISTDQGYVSNQIKMREKEIEQVAQLFGFIKTFQLKYRTATLSHLNVPEMIQKITQIFQEIQPEIIYTPNRSDAHSDHRVLFDAVIACTKSFRHPYIKQVLMYECISETEFAPALPEKVFIPNYFVDISPYLEQKTTIMKVFNSELGEHPFPRSIENIKALAHFRGAIAGVYYAEAFQLLKYLLK